MQNNTSMFKCNKFILCDVCDISKVTNCINIFLNFYFINSIRNGKQLCRQCKILRCFENLIEDYN